MKKKCRIYIGILLLLCCTAVAVYGIFHAPDSDQEVLEQELRHNEQILQQTASTPENKPVPTETEEERTITVIGDSVFLGAAPSFQKIQENVVIDAKISRQVRHGLDVAKKLNEKGKLGKVVILSLGTNGTFNPATGQELIDYLGPDRIIYWINTYGKKLEFQKEVNQTIRELVKANDNVHLIPWAEEAKKHPDWFYQDGTHLNTKGQEGFSRYIQEKINLPLSE